MLDEKNSRWRHKVAAFFGLARCENRKGQRVRTNIDVAISVDHRPMMARCVDASRHGFGIILHQPLESGQMVHLRLLGTGMAVFARVQYCASQPDGRFKAGLKLRDELRRSQTGWICQRVTAGHCGLWDDAVEFSAG